MLTTSGNDAAVTASSQPPAGTQVDGVHVEAKGLVVPPGAQSPVASLSKGTHEVKIDAVTDDGLIRCVYPDGFVKHHQADAVEDLLGKLTSQIRARYGVADVQFTSAPKKLAAGKTITVEV